MTVEPSAPIAVVGFGTMGAGIGHLAAGAGHQVLAYDALEGVVDRGIDAVRIRLDRSVEKGGLTVEEAHAILNRITPCASLHDLAPAWLVIEAVVEDLDAKRSVFAQLEEIVGDDCILATNTSSLSVTSLAAGLRRPERIVGMHFFYPAPVMPLVEVVSGLTTSPEVADTAFRTAQAWDKTPVHTSSTPGFIVNRVARPFYGEALRLLAEGAADVATIDAVLREGGGFRMGPFELLDLIGIDVSLAVSESVYAASNFDPRFAPSPIQQELVRAGRFGRKTGQGFYDHEPGIEAAHPQTVPPQARPQSLVAVGDLGIFEPMVDEAARAGIPIERGRPSGTAHFIVDGIRLELTCGVLATERAAALATDVVVFDLVLDYTGPGRMAVAVADQTGPGALESAAGLFQAIGKEVSAVDDAPGLIVMRTVAMLTNIGCDAVHQGVCNFAAVDTAMRLGTNYPRGPMEWGDLIGPTTLVTVLDNLAKAYGEDRYRVSPLLRRRALASRSLLG